MTPKGKFALYIFALLVCVALGTTIYVLTRKKDDDEDDGTGEGAFTPAPADTESGSADKEAILKAPRIPLYFIRQYTKTLTCTSPMGGDIRDLFPGVEPIIIGYVLAKDIPGKSIPLGNSYSPSMKDHCPTTPNYTSCHSDGYPAEKLFDALSDGKLQISPAFILKEAIPGHTEMLLVTYCAQVGNTCTITPKETKRNPQSCSGCPSSDAVVLGYIFKDPS